MTIYRKEVIDHLRANGLPDDWHDRTWQQQLTWLKEHSDPDNEYHMSCHQGCMEMKYNVQ